jgi:hypothetical protein
MTESPTDIRCDLFVAKIDEPELQSVTIPAITVSLMEGAQAQRDKILEEGKKFLHLANAEEQSAAVLWCRQQKGHMKDVESWRKKIKAPILAGSELLDTTASNYCDPIDELVKHIGRKVTDFQLKANEAAAKAVAAHLEKIRNLEREQLEAQVKANNEPDPDLALHAQEKATELQENLRQVAIAPPVIAKPQGFSERHPMRYEILDKAEVYKRWPHFFNLEERKQIINDTIFPGFECPGMRIWEDTQAVFKAI